MLLGGGGGNHSRFSVWNFDVMTWVFHVLVEIGHDRFVASSIPFRHEVIRCYITWATDTESLNNQLINHLKHSSGWNLCVPSAIFGNSKFCPQSALMGLVRIVE
jgi:hypothetical protein